jgi:hypothetical protein
MKLTFPMSVKLEKWEYRRAVEVGVGRMLEREKSSDMPYYDKSRMQNELNASIAAAVCECAVAKAFNRYWHGGVWTTDEHEVFKKQYGDVGHNIEVKRIRSLKNSVAINNTDTGKFIVAAMAQEPDYRGADIIGCISGSAGWSVSEPAPSDATGRRRVIPLDQLIREIEV